MREQPIERDLKVLQFLAERSASDETVTVDRGRLARLVEYVYSLGMRAEPAHPEPGARAHGGAIKPQEIDSMGWMDRVASALGRGWQEQVPERKEPTLALRDDKQEVVARAELTEHRRPDEWGNLARRDEPAHAPKELPGMALEHDVSSKTLQAMATEPHDSSDPYLPIKSPAYIKREAELTELHEREGRSSVPAEMRGQVRAPDDKFEFTVLAVKGDYALVERMEEGYGEREVMRVHEAKQSFEGLRDEAARLWKIEHEHDGTNRLQEAIRAFEAVKGLSPEDAGYEAALSAGKRTLKYPGVDAKMAEYVTLLDNYERALKLAADPAQDASHVTDYADARDRLEYWKRAHGLKADPHWGRELQHEHAQPGRTYTGPIREVTDTIVRQEVDGKIVVHGRQALVGTHALFDGKHTADVEIRYPHGRVGIAREAGHEHEHKHREHQKEGPSMSMER